MPAPLSPRARDPTRADIQWPDGALGPRRRRCPIVRLAGIALGLLTLAACAKTVDRFTIQRVVDRGTDFADVDSVCGIGHALTHPLGSLPGRDPDKALMISETVSGLCAEADAWEAELDAARAMRNFKELGEVRADEVVDARLRAQRHHALAAARFERGWQHLLAQYPGLDAGECPRIKERDEFVAILGMVGGVLALFHDRAGGGEVGVPLDRPLGATRAAQCFANEAWWSVPQAIAGGSWATVPGSAPEGVDPWAHLDDAAVRGDATGTRVARAIQVLIAANSGRDDVLEPAIEAFAAVEAAPDPDWVLLDEYARLVVQHQSDLIWTRARGHRTRSLGVLPSTDAETDLVPLTGDDDPFGSDPFGPADGEQEDSP